ncbi:MAG: SusD/RagB family nutrient-binding outer membrane lipoprotein [Tannerellaceae bacterium]|jgi:hypothetical protein|nr:SusD/RagB family nutrient-binding outer membrane lipoprotein [Tannerellaceae bacterium]
MKTKIGLGLAVLVSALAGCDLEINENPNAATGAVITPDLTFPDVVANTTYTQVYYFGYGSSAYLVGYQVPGGGIGGFGEVYTYSITASFVKECWTRTFDDLRDLQTIIRKSESEREYALYGGVSRIWKAYNYQLLVDAYGDVPYKEGVAGGAGVFAPVYDDDASVYRYLVEELDVAIAQLQASRTEAGLVSLTSASDPVFHGDVEKWIQFANNLKLRLLVRGSGTEIDAFVEAAYGTFSAEGFLKEDVVVNPGYNANSEENPYWATYHSSVSGVITQAGRFYLPSKYVFAFYDGTKLSDPVRGALVYRGYPAVPAWQLGDDSAERPNSPTYLWHVGTGIGTGASEAKGILKSRSAGAPIFTASEVYFLLAEAALKGHELDGDVKTNFEAGIEASYGYLELEGTSTTLSAGVDPREETEAYIAANEESYLVNIDRASTPEEKLEAIITQKYIALNILGSNEAWNEFRRTTYPRISGTDAVTTFVSSRSSSPRADKLPVRLIYPQDELNLNPNAPRIADAYSARLFWDKD